MVMLTLPSSGSSLLVRTDFTDSAAWQRVRSAVRTESVDGFLAYLTIVDDRVFDGASSEDLREAAVVGENHPPVLFIVDHAALGAGHPIQVVNLRGKSRPSFRCIARELWSVENNLSIANMDWEEFADRADTDGVFRGFE
jgi:hypothetical protein